MDPAPESPSGVVASLLIAGQAVRFYRREQLWINHRQAQCHPVCHGEEIGVTLQLPAHLVAVPSESG